MDSVIVCGLKILKFEEISRTLAMLKNLTDIVLVGVDLESFVIPKFVPVFKQLKTLELVFCHNVSSKFFTKCSRLESLILIANTVDVGLFDINEILTPLTFLESLTIFELEPFGSTNFLETNISDQIQFKLKTFVFYQFAPHQPNLIRFLETQKELRFIGIHLFDPVMMQILLSYKDFLMGLFSCLLMMIKKSIEDHKGFHLNFHVESGWETERMAFFMELKRIFSKIEVLTLYVSSSLFSNSPADLINGFSKVKVLEYINTNGNLAQMLENLKLGEQLTELRLLGSNLPLAVWTNFIQKHRQLKKVHLKISTAAENDFAEATRKLPRLEKFELEAPSQEEFLNYYWE
jgi:hypothetical protein